MSPLKQDPCVPDGNGLKCIGAFRRVASVEADAEGTVHWEVDLSVPPFSSIPPGAVRYIQLRYQDPGAGAGAFNWAEPVKVTFCE
jgi:hypothetical protein